MIPAKVDDTMRELMVANILAVFDAATPQQRAAGECWYADAHQLARQFGCGDTAKGAGIIAALSANKSWAANVALARRAALEGKASGHVGDALRKADAILDGVPPEFILPMDAKTGQFYRCIVDPTDPDAVCVDRHAHDIAVGEIHGNRDRGLSAKGRYAAIADAYRTAAQQRNVNPATMQAVTWVAHTV